MKSYQIKDMPTFSNESKLIITKDMYVLFEDHDKRQLVKLKVSELMEIISKQ